MVNVLWDDHTLRVRVAVEEERVQQELPHVQSSDRILEGAGARPGSSLGEKGQGMGHVLCCQWLL